MTCVYCSYFIVLIILLIPFCCFGDNDTDITCIMNDNMDIIDINGYNEKYIFGNEISIDINMVSLTAISCRESHLPRDIIKMLDLTDPGMTRTTLSDDKHFIPCLPRFEHSKLGIYVYV